MPVLQLTAALPHPVVVTHQQRLAKRAAAEPRLPPRCVSCEVVHLPSSLPHTLLRFHNTRCLLNFLSLHEEVDQRGGHALHWVFSPPGSQTTTHSVLSEFIQRTKFQCSFDVY